MATDSDLEWERKRAEYFRREAEQNEWGLYFVLGVVGLFVGLALLSALFV